VTPAKRSKGSKPKSAEDQEEQTPVRRHAAMTWAQRLKRVSPTVGALGEIDVEKCRICGGTAKVIACIEDPVVIKKRRLQAVEIYFVHTNHPVRIIVGAITRTCAHSVLSTTAVGYASSARVTRMNKYTGVIGQE